MTIPKNYTCYHTGDVEELLKAVVATKTNLPSYDWKARAYVMGPASPRPCLKPSNLVALDSLSGKRPVSRGQHSRKEDDPVHITPNSGQLLLRSKRSLLSGKWGTYEEKDFISSSGDPVLTGLALRKVVRCLFDNAYQSYLDRIHSWKHARLRNATVGGTVSGHELVVEAEESLERSVTLAINTFVESTALEGIRILTASPDQKPRKKSKKSTPSEKAQRLYAFYGKPTPADRTLYGGGQTSKYQWDDRFQKGIEYYHREWMRRQKHRKKLVALGENPVPYETAAEYLRKMADQWEADNAMLVLSQAGWGDE